MSFSQTDASLAVQIKFFKQIPFFSQLPDHKLSNIIHACLPRDFAQGQVVFEQGAVGDGMYIISFGEAVVERNGKGIARLGTNDFFGEIALISPEPRTATVRSGSELLATLFLSKTVFDEIKSDLGDEVRQEVLRRVKENYEKDTGK